jgi:hypothetical protein
MYKLLDSKQPHEMQQSVLFMHADLRWTTSEARILPLIRRRLSLCKRLRVSPADLRGSYL